MAFSLLKPLQNPPLSLSFLLRPLSTLPLLPPFEPSRDADLLSTILVTHHNPFHPSESPSQLTGITLTPHLIHQTLLRLKNSSKIALSFLTWTRIHHPPDPTSFHLLIDALAKVRQFDATWQLILQITPSPTVTPFLILIKRLISANLTKQALRAYRDIETFTNSAPEYSHFIFLLDTLCKYGHVRTAMEVFSNKGGLNFRVFERDVKMYTVLIYGWVRIGRVDMGEKLMREMVERYGIEANVVTYNVLLDGVCRRASLHPEERFERTVMRAEKVFDEMSQRGISPDVTSFSILLHVYSRSHKPDLTLDKLKEMKQRGICPTVATYTSVVKCLCSCGRIEDAEKLLEEMISNGVSPSSVTYNCFFKEYRGRKDADGALRLYRKMRGESIHLPSANTYNILISMFVRLDKMDVVREVWENMKEAGGVGPDLDSYTVLVHELCGKEKWREACKYFVEMIEKGLLPQKVTFEKLYKGLIQSNKMRTWWRLKKRLDEEAIMFSSEFKQYQLKPYRRHIYEGCNGNFASWTSIIFGMAKRLADLHQMGITHCNLKSSNKLIDGSGEFKGEEYCLVNLFPSLDGYVLSSKIRSCARYTKMCEKGIGMVLVPSDIIQNKMTKERFKY